MKLLKFFLIICVFLLSNLSYAGLGSDFSKFPLWLQVILLALSGIMWTLAIYCILIEPIIKKMKKKIKK